MCAELSKKNVHFGLFGRFADLLFVCRQVSAIWCNTVSETLWHFCVFYCRIIPFCVTLICDKYFNIQIKFKSVSLWAFCIRDICIKHNGFELVSLSVSCCDIPAAETTLKVFTREMSTDFRHIPQSQNFTNQTFISLNRQLASSDSAVNTSEKLTKSHFVSKSKMSRLLERATLTLRSSRRSNRNQRYVRSEQKRKSTAAMTTRSRGKPESCSRRLSFMCCNSYRRPQCC